MSRRGLRLTPPPPRMLIEPRLFAINGKMVTLGACCKCGRSLSGSHLNKTGVRCYYEGAQYDQDGKYLYDARTERLYKAAEKARAVRNEINNLKHFELLMALVEAAEGVCAQ